MDYNFSKLWSEQFWGFYQFKSFYEYASDEETQIDYYKRLGVVTCDRDGKMKEIKTPQALIDDYIRSNKETLDIIKNHFIVFLFTRYEFVIQETMKCLINDKPERILDFIKKYPDYKEMLGFSLSEFLKSNSKEEYIAVISDRLSSRILNGKPSQVINRLNWLINFENIKTDLLDDLMTKRNKIIHEGQVYVLELNELEMYYQTIEELLKSMALALKNVNISVIDEGELLAGNTLATENQ